MRRGGTRNTQAGRGRRRGSSAVELALVFLPTVALLLGVFELARAMWTSHSVSAAVKKAARHAVVHGSNCSVESTECGQRVADVAEVIREASLGLEPDRFRITLEAGPQIIACATLTSCLSDASYWPTSPNNGVGRQITISGEYSFHTFVFALWPGMDQTGFTFRSASSEVIQF